MARAEIKVPEMKKSNSLKWRRRGKGRRQPNLLSKLHIARRRKVKKIKTNAKPWVKGVNLQDLKAAPSKK
jgi:hypothetical protein